MIAGPVRNATNNPFEPGSDRIPRVWAGRQRQLADWRDRLRPRRAGGLYERGRTLLGEPGIGKSVLVRRLAADAARDGDLVTPQVRIPRGVDPVPLLAGALLDLADQAGLPSAREDRLGDLFARVRELSVVGVQVAVDAPEARPPHAILTDLLVELGRAAAVDRRVVLVHVDEVQNVETDRALSQLLVALGDALAFEYVAEAPGGRIDLALPIAVYLTGLPEFADQASSRAGATFARRFATEVLEPLADDDLEAALAPFIRSGWPVADEEGGTVLVTMSPEAAAAIVERCHGDPFLFQLAGQHAWDAGTAAQIEADDVARGWERARFEARQHVERQLARLPATERAMVETMADLDPDERTATAIARVMGYERASQIGPTAQRLDTVRGLIARGSPYRFRVRTVEAYLQGVWP